MKLGKLVIIGVIVILLASITAVGATPNAKVTKTDNENRPTEIVQYGSGNEEGLIKVLHIQYRYANVKDNQARPKPTPTPASESCYGTYLGRWAAPVKYTISDTTLVIPVIRAESAWDNATSATLFANPEMGTYPPEVYDGINSVSWGVSLSGKEWIAATTTWYNQVTKRPLESDIEFNTYYQWGDAVVNPSPQSVMDIQNIATHEIGHTLGLEDQYAQVCSPETMYGYGWYGETSKRTLEIPDIKGLKKIYGV